MKVYAAGQRQAQGTQTLHINPARHIGERAACPTAWFDAEGEPIDITITFVSGSAEVTDEVGRYLIAYNLARKTRLIIPEGVTV